MSVADHDPATDNGVTPSPRMLSFYDRLRERILARGKGSGSIRRALLLAPDLFMLLVRVTLDKEIPKSTRSLVGGALAYFVLPFDLFPEMVVGPGGFIEDVVLAAMVLSQVFSPELAPYVERHWSGDRKLHEVIKDVVQSSASLLGTNLDAKVRSVLRKRGVDVER